MTDTRRGMTLMEVLLVAALVSLIGVTVFQAFNNGVKLWGRSKGLDNDLQAVMFLEHMGEDLRSTVGIAGIPFKGIGSQVAFPAVVWAQADKHGSRSQEGMVDQIGAVQYRYDPAEKKIYRRQANYGQALKEQWGVEQELVFGVDGFLVRYYFMAEKGMEIKSLADGLVPAGVMVDVLYRDGTGGQHRMRRFLPVPIG